MLGILKPNSLHTPIAQRKTTTAKACLKLQHGLADSATRFLTSIVRPRESAPASRTFCFSSSLSSGTRLPGRHVFGTVPASCCTLHPAQFHPELAVTRCWLGGLCRAGILVEIAASHAFA
jgi:hypothetical protein